MYGGVVYITRTTFTTTFTYHKNNYSAVQWGGAIILCIREGNISTSDSHYTKNRARHGGAIYINGSSVVFSSHDSYTYNSAHSFGGAIGGNRSSIKTLTLTTVPKKDWP